MTVDYKAKYGQQLQAIKDNYKAFDQPYNGKDNNDYVNGKDPYIYIQTRNGNVILSDYNFGNYKSGGLRKMMRIVYHYAKKTGATQHATTIGVDASTPKGTDSNTLAYTLNDKIIRVLVKKGFFNKELSQIYNMSSTLSHESFHTQIRGKSREEEIQVIMRQMQAPEFKKTTASFKEGTAGYLQKELQKLYKENNRIFNKYIEKASELLKANGVNSVPTYLNGGNEIQF